MSWGGGQETQNDRYSSNGRKMFLILTSVQPYERVDQLSNKTRQNPGPGKGLGP